MTKKKIGNYRKLDEVLGDIIANSNEPVSAKTLESKLYKNYKVSQLKVNPRTIGQRLRGRPNVRVIQQKKTNFYTNF